MDLKKRRDELLTELQKNKQTFEIAATNVQRIEGALALLDEQLKESAPEKKPTPINRAERRRLAKTNE